MDLYIKKAFRTTTDNMIIVQPLVVMLIFLMFTSSALTQHTNTVSYVIFLTTNLLLCTAFLAGWFYMVIKTIKHQKKVESGFYKKFKERLEASRALGKEFFPGVGMYFLPMTFTIVFYVSVYILLMFVSFKVGLKLLPNPDVNWTQFFTAANSTPAEMHKYVMSLSFSQIKAINLWMFYMGGISTLFTFLTMFLFPAVYDKKKEFYLLAPFSSFNRNIVFLCKNFLGALSIIVFLFFLNLLISLFSILLSINIVFSIAGILLTFYFMAYAVVLIFLYYEEKK